MINGIPFKKKLRSRADQFASDFFIPKLDYKNFVERNDFSERAISNFSKELELLPGILIGRLQHDGFLEPHELNYLKSSYGVVISRQ